MKLVGALGNGRFRIAIVPPVNSTTIKNFMDGLIEKVGKVAAIMDNAACHHSNATDKYEADSKGMLERIFLPAHAPRLNPIETLWRDLKRALAGGCFGSAEDLQAAIFDIVNNGELDPDKTPGLHDARGRQNAAGAHQMYHNRHDRHGVQDRGRGSLRFSA